MSSVSMLLLVLDLTGVFVFGLNGALTAMDAADLDLVGVITLGMITALGGGIIRDILIGSLPPATFSDWRYLVVAGASALVASGLRPVLTHRTSWVNLFDAAGLSLFCVTGASAALKADVGAFQAVILGAITGVGGGTIRDIVIRRVPVVLTSGLYAVPALAGAAVTVVAWKLDVDGVVSALVAAAICFGIRLAGLRYNLNVPAGLPPLRGPGDPPRRPRG